MKYIKIVLFISLSVVSTFALADDMLRVAVVDRGLTGALGNFTTTNNSPHSKYLKHDGNHYIDYRPEYKKHKRIKKQKKFKRYSPRLAKLGMLFFRQLHTTPLRR